MISMTEEIKKLFQENEPNTMVYNLRFEFDGNIFGISDIMFLLRDKRSMEEFVDARNSEEFKNIVDTINNPDNKIFDLLPSLQVSKFLINRLCRIIDDRLPLEIIRRYKEEISEAMLLTNALDGILVPDSTRTLKSIIRAWDFLLYYETYIHTPIRLGIGHADPHSMHYYRVDLTRLISGILPDSDESKYDRVLFSHLLRVPH